WTPIPPRSLIATRAAGRSSSRPTLRSLTAPCGGGQHRRQHPGGDEGDSTMGSPILPALPAPGDTQTTHREDDAGRAARRLDLRPHPPADETPVPVLHHAGAGADTMVLAGHRYERGPLLQCLQHVDPV